jgi:PAS domain S-box-containing protein
MSARLGRQLTAALALVLVVVSAAFLTFFVGLYRERLVAERGAASDQTTRLLQVALENAMLKTDLPGLRAMVARLGQEDRIVDVMIVNRQMKVRFASDKRKLGRNLDGPVRALCPQCIPPSDRSVTAFLDNGDGVEVLRTVKPVKNREPCQKCHGPVQDNPVNGVLVVDYAATGIKRQALLSAAVLGGSGVIVIIAGGLMFWMLLRRRVVRPVAQLTEASRRLAGGDLNAEVNVAGNNELAALGVAFNHMARVVRGGIETAREREAFLQALIDAMPDGLRVIDSNFRTVKANRAFCRQLGLSMGEAVGRPCYAVSHRRDEPCASTLVTCPLTELQNDDQPITCRHHHERKDGSAFFVEVAAARLPGVESGLSRNLIVEVVRDLEQEMKLSHEQKLSELGLLAAGVAHEILNPLSSIRLGLRQTSQGEENSADQLRVIDAEIDRCIEVTDRILKLAAPTGLPQLLSWNDIVPEVMSLLAFEAQSCHVAVEIDLAHDLRVIAPDSELRMLVFNLAQNAFHAMPSGGRLRIEGRKTPLETSLSFADTGVGVRSEDYVRIFQPFWSRRADGVKGTGLGLSICRATVQRLGGAIHVESDAGKGSKFIVRLRAAEAATEDHDDYESGEAHPRH